MGTYKTYISFVIQKGENHIHDSEIAELSLPKFNFYSDNTSQEVLKWVEKKQQELNSNEKLVVLNYFNISNIK